MFNPDLKIGRSTRRCAVSGRVLDPGEACYSVLIEKPDGVERIDIGLDQWNQAPEDAIGWWLAKPNGNKRDRSFAPNDVLLRLLERWEGDPEHRAMRYVLALLLLRRKVLSLDETASLLVEPEGESPSSPQLQLYSPQNDTTYVIEETRPDAEESAVLEEKLTGLLWADAA